jgi:hypothetical protein
MVKKKSPRHTIYAPLATIYAPLIFLGVIFNAIVTACYGTSPLRAAQNPPQKDLLCGFEGGYSAICRQGQVILPKLSSVKKQCHAISIFCIAEKPAEKAQRALIRSHAGAKRKPQA